jgi:hypothetical protein
MQLYKKSPQESKRPRGYELQHCNKTIHSWIIQSIVEMETKASRLSNERNGDDASGLEYAIMYLKQVNVSVFFIIITAFRV